MKLISHRGCTNKLEPNRENSPDFIDEAIAKGYDVEIDVRMKDNRLYLGHDAPQYLIGDINWLINRKDKLWVHCKDFASLDFLILSSLRTFYHSKEDYTIINNCNLIWSHNFAGQDNENCIIPLLSLDDIALMQNHNGTFSETARSAYGICSDYVDTIKGLI